METSVVSKWEYRVEQLDNASTMQARLGDCGAEGWELVNVVADRPENEGPAKTLRMRRAANLWAFFKRRKD